MIKLPAETPTATLRYALAPDAAGVAAIEATFAAYDRMMAILAEVAPVGANLVSLHAQAYEKIRIETGLPARLVTLGLRDRAGYVAGVASARIPLDDKLFAIKGPTSLTISTVKGRVLVPFEVPGYVAGWESPFPAHLVSDGHAYEIHIAVKSKSPNRRRRPWFTKASLHVWGGCSPPSPARPSTMPRTATRSRWSSRRSARSMPAPTKRAMRSANRAPRNSASSAGARNWTPKSPALTEKIRLAVAENREDLARAGVARQIDLESQGIALERAMDFIELEIDEQTKALQAMLGARREAEVRLADLEASLAQHAPHETGRGAAATKTASADRAMAAIARVTGVPASGVPGDKELDELDRLHREKEIAARLERIKSQQ